MKSLVAIRIAVPIFLTLVVCVIAAHAGDQVIINTTSCQVTEENIPDSNGFSNNDLYLRVDFPDPGNPGTHWRLGLRDEYLKALNITDVTVKAAQMADPAYVIKHAGLADIFVPYDAGDLDPYDMRYGPSFDQVEPDDAGDPSTSSLVYPRYFVGVNIGFRPDDILCAPGCFVRSPVPKIVVECRETGVAWLCKNNKQPAKDIRRRMHEVVIWGVHDGGNYDNIIEYHFREDGSIGFRYGATGTDSIHGGAHVHNGLWRVSTKLFGESNNMVEKFAHQLALDEKSATDADIPLVKEGAVEWNPIEFTALLVESSARPARGYEFAPWNRVGTSRLRPQFLDGGLDKQLWTQHDFYVTNDYSGEDGFGGGFPYNWAYQWTSPDNTALTWANRGDPLGLGDGIVVWYTSSAHHDPTTEDNSQHSIDPSNGVTLVHWSGFDMDPHNLFDYNPLGGPDTCLK